MINRIWRILPFSGRAISSKHKHASPQPPHSLRLEQLEERTLLTASSLAVEVLPEYITQEACVSDDFTNDIPLEGTSTGSFGITDVSFNEKLYLNKSVILYADYVGTITWDLDGDGAYDDATGKIIQLCAPGAAKTESVAFSWEQLEDFGWKPDSTVTVYAKANIIYFNYGASYTFEIDSFEQADMANLTASASSSNSFAAGFPISLQGAFSVPSTQNNISGYTINSVNWSIANGGKTIFSSSTYSVLNQNASSKTFATDWTPNEDCYGNCTMTCTVNYTFDGKTQSISSSDEFTIPRSRSLDLEISTSDSDGVAQSDYISGENVFVTAVLSDLITEDIADVTVSRLTWTITDEDSQSVYSQSVSSPEPNEQTDDTFSYNLSWLSATENTGEHKITCSVTYTQDELPSQTISANTLIDLQASPLAVIAPISDPLAMGTAITLNASQSQNASSYYWDLDGDGNFDDATGKTVVLCGLDYETESSDTGISWEKLYELGWRASTEQNIGLKVVLADCDENETDTLKYSTDYASITIPSYEIPSNLLWGSYMFDVTTNELRIDDWAVTQNNQTNYYIDTIDVNQAFYDQYGNSLNEIVQLPDDWTTSSNSIDTLIWKTGGTVTVTEIMPINASFLCVCHSDGSIFKAYEYLRGEPTVTAEIFARQIAYNSFQIGDRIWYYGNPVGDQPEKILTGYFVERVFDQKNGFNAYGLVSSYDGIKPVLAIRGTEGKINDILADANPQGVGYGQYQSAYSSVSDWMTLKESRKMPPSLVGHSLGGALCQWIAAAYVSEGKHLSGVTTFNSPGISQKFAEKFNKNSALAGTVTHHIVNGDIVSMVGEEFIDGSNYLHSYSRVNVIDKHSIPVTIASICDEKNIVFEKPKDLNSSEISTADLNSYWFHYTDKYYLGYLVAISGVSRIFTGPDNVVSSMAAKLFFRGTAEQLRKSVGSYVGLIYDFNEGQFSLTNDKYIAIDSIKLSDCWSINDTVIFWDTSKGNFFCSTNLAYTPAGTSLTGDGFSLGASVSLVSYQLNSIGVRFKNENIPMGNTGLFFQEASLEVNHLNDDNPITVTGMVRLTVGYEIHGQTPGWLGGFSYSGSLASFTGSLLVSSEQFSLRGDLYIPYGEVNGTSSYLVSANGLFLFNWNQGTIQFKGNLDLMNIQVAGFLTLTWGNVPKLEVGGTAAYTFPEKLSVIGGEKLASASFAFYYSGDSNPLNDYFFVGGTLLGSGLGYRYTFDPNDSFWNNLDIIGAEKITREEAKTRQNARIPAPAHAAALFNNSTVCAKAALPELEQQERAAEVLNGKLIVELAWETTYASTNAFLNLGNGSRISENDFALYGIALSEDLVSTSVAKRYLVDLDSFDFDNWTFEIESEGARIADSVSENWFVLLDPLSVDISAVDCETDGSMTISVNTGYASDDTVLSFYCDSDNYNGLPLFQTTVGKLQDGKVTWKPENMTSGAYKLYVRAEDGDKYPAEAHFDESIEIVCAPKLVVEDSSGVPDDGAIYWGTAVQNEFALAYRWEEFVVRNDGNAVLTLTDWTLEGGGSKAFWFKAFDNDGKDINFGNTKLGVGETITIRVGLSSSFNGDSQNGFTLTAKTNDTFKPTLKLTGSVTFVKSVGTIAVSESSVGANEAIPISRLKSGTYTVVLDIKPTEDVIVNITPPIGVLTDVQSLTFTAENWNVPQEICVSQAATSGDSEIPAIIRHTVVSTDPNYNDGGIPDVVVTTGSGSDYEVAGVVVKGADYKEGGKSTKTVGAETITDWDSFYVEFWSEETQEVVAGTTAIVELTWDPVLFFLPAETIETLVIAPPSGTSVVFSAPVDNDDGTRTVEIKWTIGQDSLVTDGTDFYWGCVYFTPTLTEGAGLEDIYSEADSFGAKVKAVAYDLERNDKVDMTDFIEFAKVFNQKVEGNENPLVAVADFNGSGTVDMSDFILFAQNFNKKKTDKNVTIVHPKPTVAAVAKPVSESTPVAIPDLSQTRLLASTRLSRTTDAAILDLYDNQYESEAIDLILSEMSDERFQLD